MPKIEEGGTYNFRIDGIPYPKGGYEPFVSVGGVENVGFRNKSTGEIIQRSEPASSYTNSVNVPYASKDALLLDLETFFF